MIPAASIERYFRAIERYLLNPRTRDPFQFTTSWCSETGAGVYCYFVDDELKYVGETGCLAKRIRDARSTRNHTLRRTLGATYFKNHPEYEPATERKIFSPDLERDLSDWMIMHLKVSFLGIPIGRKEFEEWLQERHPQVQFRNKRKRRRSD